MSNAHTTAAPLHTNISRFERSIPAPAYNTDEDYFHALKVAWLGDYREQHNCSLTEAVAAWRVR